MTADERSENRDGAWTIGCDRYAPDDEPRREVVLALGNGVFVTRAALPDGSEDRHHYPGTYHAGCYDRVPNEIAGERDLTESLVNLPDWLPLALRVDGADWWRLDSLEILEYEHSLDMQAGCTRRTVLAVDAAGRRFRLCEERLVSMADPRICAMRLTLHPLDWSGTVEIRSLLDAGVVNANVRRFEDYEKRHLRLIETRFSSPATVLLRVRTSDGRTEVACGQHTRIVTPCERVRTEPAPSGAGHLLRVDAGEGQPVVIVKTAALCSTVDPSCRDTARSVMEALAGACDFDDLRRAHAAVWQSLWHRIAIEAETVDLRRALRFHAFHILQTVSPHTVSLDAGIPARGWHGEAYHGHIFWDELFVLPFLNFRFPEIARASLIYRSRRLDAAREAARKAGYRGAMYPWRSASDGREVTPRHQKNLLTGSWMRDHTYRQRHIGAAIALSAWQYWLSTGDDDFMQQYGAEMMLEIARFWGSIAEPVPGSDRYRIAGVIGPDEYHNAYPGRADAGLDNNAYTNLMAVWTLCRARELLDLLPAECSGRLRERLGLTDEELALWDRISRRMTVCFHGNGVISQFEGFDELEEFDPAMLPEPLAGERTDWALRAIGRSPDEFQASKQADVLTLFHLLDEGEVTGMLQRLGYPCGHEVLRNSADYYLPRTLHRSSLSRVVYSGALARSDPRRSWDLWRHALETDLNPLKGESVAEGIHLGSMASTIDILQRRYLGISAVVGGLRVEPALPAQLGRIRLGLRYRGQKLEAEARDGTVRITASRDNVATVRLLHGQECTVLAPGDQAVVAGTCGEVPRQQQAG